MNSSGSRPSLGRGDGSISDSELARFNAEGEALFVDMQGAAVNFTIVYSLFTTICVSLLVMSPTYASGEGPEVTEAPGAQRRVLEFYPFKIF